MAKSMNINFLVDKENERVVVSNEKGTMNPREYQDNIKDVLIKEDIVKELEGDYSVLKSNRTTLEGKLEDTNKEVENIKESKRKSKKWYLAAFLVFPFYVTLLEYLLNIKRYQAGFLEMKNISINFVTYLSVAGVIEIIYYIFSNFNFREKVKEYKKRLKEYENLLQELNLEIADLVQVITKNKAELQELVDQKERNNMEMWPKEIQKISYREALEFEKAYLTQLRSENSSNEQTKEDEKNSILGRFRRNKNEYKF